MADILSRYPTHSITTNDIDIVNTTEEEDDFPIDFQAIY